MTVDVFNKNGIVWRWVGAMLLVTASTGSANAADIVERKSAPAPLTGTVAQIARDSVTLTAGSLKKETVVPANDIVNIRWDQEPPTLNLLRADERSGQLQRAHDGYKELLGSLPASQANLKTDVEFMAARSQAKIALTDPNKLDDAIAQLDAFRKAHETNFRYYEALDHLGRLYVAKKDLSQARSVYALMAQAPWPDYKTGARIAEARAQLTAGDVDSALRAFEEIAASSEAEPSLQSRRYEALLGKVACLQAKEQHDETVKVLNTILAEIPADATSVQAEAYLRQGDSLRIAGKNKAALLAYLHVDLLFPQEESLHAESLFRLSQLWIAAGHADRAAEAAARLQNRYPNTQWTQQLSGAKTN